MAIPIALSVEYRGSQKMGSTGDSTFLRVELDATPPEKTTGSPGCILRAFLVAVSTVCATLKIAYAAVSSGV